MSTYESTVTLGPPDLHLEFPVRFTYYPGWRGTREEPEEREELVISHVKVRGHWLSSELFPDDWLQKAENDLIGSRGKSLAAEHAEEAWDRRQEQLMEEGYP